MEEHKKKFLLSSFGCQMNKLDTALVESSLKQAGFELTESIKEADAVIINTCSVREHAEQRVISHLGHLKHIKETRPELVVGVIGCMAQRLGDELLKHEAVNIVCGPAQIPQIAQMLTEALNHSKKEIFVTEKILRKPSEIQNQQLEDFESAYGIEEENIPGQSYVRVMRGCNNFCSYCIVPYVRGPESCRSPQSILEQMKKLADNGVKQVTFLGQTVNSYKYKQAGKIWSLADLLAAGSNIAGIEWLKFVTSYPSQEFFDDILQVMADSPKVCRYLHLPAQSGSDKILRAMNRNYTADGYLAMLDKARSVVPDIAIAGDFIVGFPDETEEDFQATVRLAEKAAYKNAFIFKYSPRPGTAADKKLQDNISAEVKQKRNVELLAVQEKISEQLSDKFLNQQVIVLVEGPSKKNRHTTIDTNNQQLIGRTATEYIVVFDGPLSLAGDFVQVEITKTSPLTLFGRLV
jgi:tRNA-2-methylthio-N6-dimethylallyladenosine synthase